MSEKKSPAKYAMVAAGALTLVGGLMGMSSAAANRRLAKQQADEAMAFKREQQALLNKQAQRYRSMTFKNPYEGLENVYEDLTVNQQQAQFQTQQAQQQRADIMNTFRGAAGGSGIAGLAQTMASQGALQTQRISASIGAQEARNQAMRAQGAQQAEMAQRGGAQWVQQAEMDRQATLLGMQMGQASGANLAVQQAQANQMNAQIAQQQITADMFSNMATIAASYGGGE